MRLTARCFDRLNMTIWNNPKFSLSLRACVAISWKQNDNFFCARATIIHY